MANRKPLVLVDGIPGQLSDADKLPLSAVDGAVSTSDARLSDAREWTAETVSQTEAEAGTATTRRAWTAQRVRQAIAAWWNGVTSAFGRSFVNAADAAAGRTALGLGTAATATLTTSTTDMVVGRVLKVKDFGIGDVAHRIPNGGSWNDVGELGTGFYMGLDLTDGPVTGWLIGRWECNALGLWGRLTVSQFTSTAAGSQRTWYRTLVNGVWSVWRETYDTGNLTIGTSGDAVPKLNAANTWSANQSLNGFTKLGESAPAIKTKKLTATTPSAQGSQTTVAHGLSRDKIISTTVMVPNDSGNLIPHSFKSTVGHEFDFVVDSTSVRIHLVANNSGNILSKVASIYITYEE